MVTIVGSVVSGIILEHYKDFKEKFSKWIEQRQETIQAQTGHDTFPDLEWMSNNRRRIPNLDKFCSVQTAELMEDFTALTRCYIARKMFDENLLSQQEYLALAKAFIEKRAEAMVSPVVGAFKEYEMGYSTAEDAIRPQKVFETIDAYAKGVLLRHLDSVGIFIEVPLEKKNVTYYRGLPGSIEDAVGFALLYNKESLSPKEDSILVVDSNDWSESTVDFVRDSTGVVTTHCGMTGHIPMVCRGLRKGCVILDANSSRK